MNKLKKGTNTLKPYPELKPHHTEMLKVGDLHEIYVERSGKINGVPVVFLHGGPGSATNPNHRRYFDPDFFDIFLFDQRGCGKSIPSGAIEQNTTSDLINDIRTIRARFDISRKMVVFGGSWGSALAVAYAKAYPNDIEALVLRGVFLASSDEVNWFTNDLRRFMPEAHHQMSDGLDGDLVSKYFEMVNSADKSKASRAASRWLEYEAQSMMLGKVRSKSSGKLLSDDADIAKCRVQLHYLMNGCFFSPSELLTAAKTIETPVAIVQGELDMICPPINAYNLHNALPNSTLKIIADGGHNAWEPNIATVLVSEMEALKQRLR